MKKLCREIVKNIQCWICGSELEKKQTNFCWIIECVNKKCKAHAILITKNELDKIEK
jgi:hypothetical protein